VGASGLRNSLIFFRQTHLSPDLAIPKHATGIDFFDLNGHQINLGEIFLGADEQAAGLAYTRVIH